MSRLVRRYVAMPRTPALGQSVVPPAIIGAAGTWVNLTPAAVTLAAGYSQAIGSGNTNDNYGVQDLVADRFRAYRIGMTVCYQGWWESVDYGATWVKVSTGTNAHYLDEGKLWTAGQAIDGTVYTVSGNNFTGTPNGRRLVLRSTDFGRNWLTTGDLGMDPYSIACSPYDASRLLIGAHDNDTFQESLDGGASFGSCGSMGTLGNSGYVAYLSSSDRALYVGNETDGVFLIVRTGLNTWTKTAIATLAGQGHYHGSYQGFLDPTTGYFYHPSAGGTAPGIYRSTDDGASFTRIYSTSVEVSVTATPTTLHAMFAGPNNSLDASVDPKWTTAPRSPGTSWAAPTIPAGMINGGKTLVVVTDGARQRVLAGCWQGGLWGYIEP